MFKKKDGSNRVCVDFRKLNKITEVDPEPMMTAEDLFCRQSGKKYLSKLDLTKRYWQLPVDAEDVYKTVFVTPDGQYEFLQMLFGVLKKILQRLSGVDHQEAIKSFLGLVGYYREHILAFAEVSAPLPISSRKESQNKYNGMRHRSVHTHCSTSTCYKN